MRAERARLARGAPARDIDAVSAWRGQAFSANLELLSLYGRYLYGQMSGMSRALPLESIRFALELEVVPRETWPDMVERLIYLHSIVMENEPEK